MTIDSPNTLRFKDMVVLDATIRRVIEGLERAGHAELRKLLVEAHESDRVVVLRGRVSSYYLKQRAQEVAKLTNGAVHVVNAIEVVQEQPLGRASATEPLSRRGGKPMGGCRDEG